MTAPTPIELARVTGRDRVNPGRFKRRLDPADIEGLGPPPAHLDANQRAVWEMFRSEAPWLTAADRGLTEIATRLRSRMMNDGWQASVAL